MKKVLIVDDEPYIAMVLHAILQKNLDCEVKVSGSMRESLHILETFTPDLVILDIHLGDGTAYDILPVLKSNPGKDIKVVMMSARISEAEHRKISENGIDLFIEKPFNKDKIVQALHSLNYI